MAVRKLLISFIHFHRRRSSSNLSLLDNCVSLCMVISTNTRKRKKCWVKDYFRKRDQYGAYKLTLQELRMKDPYSFRQYLRMKTHVYEVVICYVLLLFNVLRFSFGSRKLRKFEHLGRSNSILRSFNFFTVNPFLFQRLVELVGPIIAKKNYMRKCITAVEKLAVTSRFAKGNTYFDLAFQFRMHH